MVPEMRLFFEFFGSAGLSVNKKSSLEKLVVNKEGLLELETLGISSQPTTKKVFCSNNLFISEVAISWGFTILESKEGSSLTREPHLFIKSSAFCSLNFSKRTLVGINGSDFDKSRQGLGTNLRGAVSLEAV